MKRDVFISYSRKNYDAVMEIKRQIDTATGADCCWLDLEDIESGTSSFDNAIVDAIDNCKVMLFMLSNESMESKYALKEIYYAEDEGKKVVLVNIDGCCLKRVFKLRYGLSDRIAWSDEHQREKLLRDVKKWVGGGKKEEPQPEPPRVAAQSVDPLKEIEERIARLEKEVGEVEPFMGPNGKWGFKDKSGKVAISCQWYSAMPFSEGLAVVEDKNGWWGFIDKSGKIIIPCYWNYAWSFSEGLAVVEASNEKRGFIDKSGKVVIHCLWEYASSFSEGLAAVITSSRKCGFIDKNGRVVIPCKWDGVCDFKEGLAGVSSNGKYGFIDKNGKVVIPCQWDDADWFRESLAKVMDGNGKWWKIDKSGKVVGEA